MIEDMEGNKKLSSIVTELFIRGRKLDILLLFISQSYFKVPKIITLNVTHCFMMEIPNKRELPQRKSNHSSDIEFKGFMKLYKDYTQEPFSILVKDATSTTDNPLRLRKNLQ